METSYDAALSEGVERESVPPRRPLLHEFVDTFLPAIAVVLVVNLFLAQPRTVHGQSMEPCLHENERVIIDLVSLHWRAPRRGEIVVLRLPNRHSDPLIKRVIGLPGDTVAIRGGKVPKRIDTGVTVVTMKNFNQPDVQKLLYPMGK